MLFWRLHVQVSHSISLHSHAVSSFKHPGPITSTISFPYLFSTLEPLHNQNPTSSTILDPHHPSLPIPPFTQVQPLVSFQPRSALHVVLQSPGQGTGSGSTRSRQDPRMRGGAPRERGGEMWRWWDERGLGIEYVGLCNGGGSGIGIGVVKSEVGGWVVSLV
jgi:hypothetical protein